MPRRATPLTKPPAESKRHAWDAAGYITVSVKFTPELHQRARQHAAKFRGRLLTALVTAAVEHVLDEIDAGRPPEAVAERLRSAETAQSRKPVTAAEGT
jgi:hypothetical protein